MSNKPSTKKSTLSTKLWVHIFKVQTYIMIQTIKIHWVLSKAHKIKYKMNCSKSWLNSWTDCNLQKNKRNCLRDLIKKENAEDSLTLNNFYKSSKPDKM